MKMINMRKNFKTVIEITNLLLITIQAFQFGINGGKILVTTKYSKTLKVKVDPELYKRLKKEAKKFDTDIPTYVRWCIKTGLYLDDLNLFVRTCGEGPEKFEALG